MNDRPQGQPNSGQGRPEPVFVFPRALDEVLEMAVVVQANLAQLKTAEVKRREASTDEVDVPSPGPVTARRDALIDHRRIKGYTDAALHLRLHEIWGQFCVFCWALQVPDPKQPPSFRREAFDRDMQCGSALQLKKAEIEAMFWRLRFEQRVRSDAAFRASSECQTLTPVADRIPVQVFGVDPRSCEDDALLVAACEHAGMLAAIRWISDRRWTWAQDGIMELDEREVLGDLADAPDDP